MLCTVFLQGAARMQHETGAAQGRCIQLAGSSCEGQGEALHNKTHPRPMSSASTAPKPLRRLLTSHWKPRTWPQETLNSAGLSSSRSFHSLLWHAPQAHAVPEVQACGIPPAAGVVSYHEDYPTLPD